MSQKNGDDDKSIISSMFLGDSSSPEEIVRVWLEIGKELGIDMIFPHIHCVLCQVGDEEETVFVGLVGSPSEEMVDILVSDDVMTEEILDLGLEAVMDRKRNIH